MLEPLFASCPCFQLRLPRSTMSSATRAEVLSTYRGILREVTKQYVRFNGNLFWRQQVMATYRMRASKDVEPKVLRGFVTDGENLLSYLRSGREHKEMMERYWPTSGLTTSEKLTKTANKVGFAMPKRLGNILGLGDADAAAEVREAREASEAAGPDAAGPAPTSRSG
ncbi:hypothetical protein BC831DRAFT_471174 [Entophlyctis helioformis]|nr:hypothetical protein BC831DRAFT_471174 [Entophlyctis helioformis]